MYIGTAILLMCAAASGGIALVSHFPYLLFVSLFMVGFAIYNQLKLKV